MSSIIGDITKDPTELDVIPVYERLRRELPFYVRLGVLCGSVIIIPNAARTALESLTKDKCPITLSDIPHTEYTEVRFGGAESNGVEVL